MIELLLEAERALERRKLDEAERLFRQAADADRANSIALAGLARVAFERGDVDGSRRLAGSARERDPENAAARRIVSGAGAAPAPVPVPRAGAPRPDGQAGARTRGTPARRPRGRGFLRRLFGGR